MFISIVIEIVIVERRGDSVVTQGESRVGTVYRIRDFKHNIQRHRNGLAPTRPIHFERVDADISVRGNINAPAATTSILDRIESRQAAYTLFDFEGRVRGAMHDKFGSAPNDHSISGRVFRIGDKFAAMFLPDEIFGSAKLVGIFDKNPRTFGVGGISIK